MKRTAPTASGDTTLTALDCGEGDVVVLAHSYLWGAEMWRPQIDALSQYYRVVVPNLWGHGDSGNLPPDVKDLRGIALRHLQLFDRLAIDRFAFVGQMLESIDG